MVEATRVELVSENRFLQLSTSVVYLTNSGQKPPINRLQLSVVQMPFNGVNRPKNRSPLRYAAAQAVVLLGRDTDLVATCKLLLKLTEIFLLAFNLKRAPF